MAINTTSFTKTPQANGDAYWWTEDDLIASGLLSGSLVTLNVMANDLGGNAKKLWSIDDGNGNTNLADYDLVASDMAGTWENAAINNLGVADRITIANGQILLDLGTSLGHLGAAGVNGLADGDHIHDEFVYAIRLANGTLSQATVTVDVWGLNDQATITGDTAASLTEDDTSPATGTLAVIDPDHGQSVARTVTGGATDAGYGTYSVDAGGHWSYTVDNALVQYLAVGESLSDSFTVTSLDGTASQPVTVTITGVNDAPVIDTSAPMLDFLPTAFYTTGTGPEGVAAGDLNGDGFTDLATGDVYGGTLSILLNNGDGTFRSPTLISLASAPHTVAIADMNGDGKLDLVAEADSARNLEVFLGNGNGTFQAPIVTSPLTATGGDINGPIVDLNGDGKLDVMVTYQYLNQVGIFLGNGDGTFQPQVLYAAGDGPAALGIADFNGDGKFDLAIGQANQASVVVLLGTGGGAFGAPIVMPIAGIGSYASPIRTADINGDGKIDLAVGGTAGTAVMLGQGDGTFGAPTLATTAGQPVGLRDMNGDGKIDLVVDRPSTHTISVALGNGDGTFQSASSFAGGTFPIASGVIADLNGDGRPDIAVPNVEGTSNVSVLLNNSSTGGAGFTATVYDTAALTTLTAASSFTFDDVDLNDSHSVSVTPHAGALGNLAASVLQDTTGVGTGGRIGWNYQVDETAVHSLSGATTDTFTLTIADGHGGTAAAAINISLLP